MTSPRRPLAVVTGASRGIGAGVALRLAEAGYDLALTARASGTADRAVARVREAAAGSGPGGRVEWLPADLSSMDEVVALATSIRGLGSPDVLLHCAAVVPSEGRTTRDGFEIQWAVNHLAPFLLTALVPATSREGAEPDRVVTVSSKLHRNGSLPATDPSFEVGAYDPSRRYADTKLANVLFARALARREGPGGRVSMALHPGVAGTRLNQDLMGVRTLDRVLNRAIRAVRGAEAWGLEECVARVSDVCTRPLTADDHGSYREDGRIVEPAPEAMDDARGEALWAATERALRPWLETGTGG